MQIHWFSIFNSFMMVIFLTGLVSMILMRTLRADYARYTPRRTMTWKPWSGTWVRSLGKHQRQSESAL